MESDPGTEFVASIGAEAIQEDPQRSDDELLSSAGPRGNGVELDAMNTETEPSGAYEPLTDETTPENGAAGSAMLNDETTPSLATRESPGDPSAVVAPESDVPPKKPAAKKANWPLRGIVDPHINDVLYGRGGGTNHHPGNKRYRKIVEDKKHEYVCAKRLDKPQVALTIVQAWRDQDPPGRFLKLDERTNLWHDVGDKKAREKTSQALREKAPQIRREMEEQAARDRGDDDDSDDVSSLGDDEDLDQIKKVTRIANGSKTTDGSKVCKALLARDHSLGREILEAGESVDIGGFSWQEPLENDGKGRYTQRQPRYPENSRMPPREESWEPAPESMRYPSHGSMGPPPLPAAGPYPRYDSWTSLPPSRVPSYGYPPQPMMSWSTRDHSLSQNPLAHASVNQPAPWHTFSGTRTPSGHWVQYPPPPNASYGYGMPVPPPPSQASYYPPPHTGPPISPTSSSSRSMVKPKSPSRSAPASPHYEVDPAVAHQWSSQMYMDIGRTYSEDSGYDRLRSSVEVGRSHTRLEITDKRPGHTKPHVGPGQGVVKDARQTTSKMPKPEVVKRITSNQNETPETKPDLQGPSVKRAALNRDQSATANRLKATYASSRRGRMADQLQRTYATPSSTALEETGPFNSDLEIRQLSRNFSEQSSITQLPRPRFVTEQNRMSTLDSIAMELIVPTMGDPDRTISMQSESIIDALGLDLLVEDESKPVGRPNRLTERTSTMDAIFESLQRDIPRPPAISKDDRLTTTDLLEMVNEPLGIDDDEMLLMDGT